MNIIHDEVWKDIPDFERYYQVSTLGRVRSVGRTVIYKDGRIAYFKSKIMKQGTNLKGYKKAYFSKDCIQSSHQVHALVMLAFVGARPNPKIQINHIDCDKTNNSLINLEYCTQSHNQLHAFANGLIDRKGEKSHSAKFKNGDIYDICLNRMNGKSVSTIATEYNVSRYTIHRILRGSSYRMALRP